MQGAFGPDKSERVVGGSQKVSVGTSAGRDGKPARNTSREMSSGEAGAERPLLVDTPIRKAALTHTQSGLSASIEPDPAGLMLEAR